MENIDSRLLRNQGEEQEAARKLKEKKRGAAGEEGSSSAEATEDKGDEADATGPSASSGQDEPRSLRQRVQAARQALNIKERAKEKIKEKITAPAKTGTSKLLQQAWLNLIDSFGLTLIWINIHVFLRYVVGEKLFCKLGEEWIPKQISAVGGEAGKTAGKTIGLVEVMGLLFLDLIVLFIILGALAQIVMVVDFMQAGFLKKIAAIIGGLTNISWSGIKALFSIFAK